MWGWSGAYRVLVGRPEGKRPSGRPRIILKHVFMKCEDMNWIALLQDRGRWRDILNVVMNLRVPQNAVNFLRTF